MTGIFSSLPQGSKDYQICVVLIAIGIIFYYLGQMGIAMVFFSIGIVLYLFFSYTYSFHMWRSVAMMTLLTIMMRVSMTSMMTLLLMKIREAMMPMVKIRTIKDESHHRIPGVPC
jgi:hypothetical protein